MAGEFTIKVDGGREVQAAMKRLTRRGRRVVAAVVDEAALDIETRVKKNLQENQNVDRGRLRGSYRRRRIPGTFGLTSEVGTDVPYAPFLEFGTSPHTPPFNVILEWTGRKTGLKGKAQRAMAGAVWATIRKSGTRPHPHLGPAANDARGPYLRNMTAAIRGLERF